MLLTQRHDIWPRVEDALDLAGQPLVRREHLGLIAMAVIGAAHAANDVAEAAFGVVVRDASAREQRPCRAPQIVNHPIGDAGISVKSFLPAPEVGNRPPARSEYVRHTIDA